MLHCINDLVQQYDRRLGSFIATCDAEHMQACCHTMHPDPGPCSGVFLTSMCRSEKERARGDKEVWACKENRVGLLERGGDRFIPKYAFDLVFDASSTNAQIFQAVGRSCVIPALTGINGTIFAYGVTSSGKTHTMFGDERDPGMVPCVVQDLFQHIQSNPGRMFIVKMAVMEIYNEVGCSMMMMMPSGRCRRSYSMPTCCCTAPRQPLVDCRLPCCSAHAVGHRRQAPAAVVCACFSNPSWCCISHLQPEQRHAPLSRYCQP
jgi:hypothetical protein